MSAAQENVVIWDKLYDDQPILWYPYEVAVRLVRRHMGREGMTGVVLDHGCGSGNHLEFFVRLGLQAHGTEVSQTGLDRLRARFEGAMLPLPPVTLFNPDEPLPPQLPDYDHAFIWGSIHYNALPKTVEDIQAIIDGLPAGGVFIMAIPSPNDVVYARSEAMADGSRKITDQVSGQLGAVVTVPSDRDQLLSWCSGVTVRDCATFGWTLGGVGSEFFFVYGVKD